MMFASMYIDTPSQACSSIAQIRLDKSYFPVTNNPFLQSTVKPRIDTEDDPFVL